MPRAELNCQVLLGETSYDKENLLFETII